MSRDTERPQPIMTNFSLNNDNQMTLTQRQGIGLTKLLQNVNLID
jgi:hypothetical protein